MNYCKVSQAQAKTTELTWLNARGSGAGSVQLHGTKKRLAKGKELNSLVTNAVKEVLK